MISRILAYDRSFQSKNCGKLLNQIMPKFYTHKKWSSPLLAFILQILTKLAPFTPVKHRPSLTVCKYTGSLRVLYCRL
jgi:hypothetical protein